MHADRAMRILPSGGIDWIRADDIKRAAQRKPS
jgi:hypothetical protein